MTHGTPRDRFQMPSIHWGQQAQTLILGSRSYWELDSRIPDALNISTDDAVRRHVAIDPAREQAQTKDGGYAIHRLHFLVGRRKMQP